MTTDMFLIPSHGKTNKNIIHMFLWRDLDQILVQHWLAPRAYFVLQQ